MVEHKDEEGYDDHKEITVETLSTPPVQIEPAPLSKRIAAGLIDLVILSFGWVILMLSAGRVLSEIYGAFLTSSGDLYFALLVLAYFLILEGMFGATIGKFLLGLRVLGKDGEQCSFNASFTRNLLRFVDWLPLFYIVGALAMTMSPKRQRIGDRLAGTIVSEAPKRDINPPPAPFLFH